MSPNKCRAGIGAQRGILLEPHDPSTGEAQLWLGDMGSEVERSNPRS